MKCYVIVAGEGEYSDRGEWPFLVFTDKDKAQAMIKKLEAIHEKYKRISRIYFSTTDEGRAIEWKERNEATKTEYAELLGPTERYYGGNTDWKLEEAEFRS